LAALPPLWFRVMDPKVLAWAGGDVTKLNRGDRDVTGIGARRLESDRST
jgi:alkane 1-monooxygenase